MSAAQRSRIFISYSHRGNGLAWKNRLLAQLAGFEKHRLLDAWHDDEITLGDNWHQRTVTAGKFSSSVCDKGCANLQLVPRMATYGEAGKQSKAS